TAKKLRAANSRISSSESSSSLLRMVSAPTFAFMATLPRRRSSMDVRPTPKVPAAFLTDIPPSIAAQAFRTCSSSTLRRVMLSKNPKETTKVASSGSGGGSLGCISGLNARRATLWCSNES
ncbi:unnamed protein product, partial [Ectocarpus sp. 12 AP-2014]